MEKSANVVINGKKYNLPFVHDMNGYIEIKGNSITVHGKLTGVDLKIINGQIFINGIDVEKYVREHNLPELKKLKQIEHDFGLNLDKDEAKEDEFEMKILEHGIRSGVKCPRCGKNTLKTIGGLVEKCPCGYKKVSLGL
jgi:hypothetical protein